MSKYLILACLALMLTACNLPFQDKSNDGPQVDVNGMVLPESDPTLVETPATGEVVLPESDPTLAPEFEPEVMPESDPTVVQTETGDQAVLPESDPTIGP